MSKKPAPNDLQVFREIAQDVSRKELPETLIYGLRRQAQTLRLHIKSDCRLITRAEQKKRLVKIAMSAEVVKAAIANPSTFVFLQRAVEEEVSYNLYELANILEDVTRRASTAASLLSSGSGPERATPANSFSVKPQELCALTIVEAWRLCNNVLPGENNDRAHSACEKFWQSAGGREGGETLAGWRRWVGSARKMSDLPATDPRSTLSADIQHLLTTVPPELIPSSFSQIRT